MKRGIAITIFIVVICAAGCGQTKKVKVTYRSEPPGGTLLKLNGEVWGQCPKVLYYDLDEEAVENECLDAKGMVVRWPNGTMKRSDDLIRIKVDGTDRQVTFTQPKIAATPAY